MKTFFARVAALFVSLCLPAALSAQTISNVSVGVTNVAAADEWATRSFQDPMDMNQNTDLGWHVFSADQPLSGLSGAVFSGGIFSATASNPQPNFWVLETGNPVSAKLGKTGDNFPIAANTYRMFSMRMCLTGSGLNDISVAPTNPASGIQWVWTPNTAYEAGTTTAGTLFTYAGCHIYLIDLPAVSIAQGSTPWGSGSGTTIRSLRVHPVFISGTQISVDWIRLAAITTNMTVTWTGGSADIYLDTDSNQANGTLGRIVKAANSVSRAVASGFTFQASALEPGSYRVLVCATGSTSNCSYSAQFTVNGIPTITLTSPSDEGSSDDFATVQLNNPWDMNAVSDIDHSVNVASLAIENIPAEYPSGQSLGTTRVLRGTPSASNQGDAYVYPLWFAGSGRGVTKKIDTDRYRILTLEMGMPGARNIDQGSIARIVWKTTGEAAENVSQDIIVNHRAGANVLDKISVDMKRLLRETDPGLGTLGWNGDVEAFRVDPHEFGPPFFSGPPVPFWIRRIKLTALEKIDASQQYTIRWNFADAVNTSNASAATVSLFHDTDRDPASGRQPIPGCQNIAASAGSCLWSGISGLNDAGEYFIYAQISDGVNTNAAYSVYPLVYQPSFVEQPRMVLDRTSLYFGAADNGRVVGPAQQVRLSIAGSGTVSWNIAKNGAAPHLFSVAPTSGTGPATLSVSIPQSTLIPNNLNGELGTIDITSNASNSPQSIRVFLTMTASGANPFGGFDTPAAGSTLSGSVAVTGWVLDDIGVASVQVHRQAHPNDPAGAVVNGRVFVGNATLVEGARTDIETLFPTAPSSYNAGWGYLMLTRGLIWEGQGAFNLYAIATDAEGHVVELGSKAVSINNASANRPFGAIDTPGQGATVSGNTYPNTGWVLSPGTTVPASGVQVAVDGVFLPGTFSMSNRADITAGFGNTFNTTGAGRGMFIDTTQFADGVHTIGWLVTDNLGRQDGVGSRFFRTQNGNLLTTAANTAAPVRVTRPAFAGATTAFARLGERVTTIDAPARAAAIVRMGRGMTPRPRLTPVGFDPFGARAIRVDEMERVEVHAGVRAQGVTYAAYRVVDGYLRLLPLGSSFDTASGTFYWQPGAGFIGDYDFAIVKLRNGREVEQVPVRITVGPSSATLRARALSATAIVAGR